MPARRAIPFIYHLCTRNLDDDTRLEVDAILGDPAAQEAMQAKRRELIGMIDAEIA